MKILVIGATGYLGGAAAQLLQKMGNEVVTTARSDRARERLTSLGYGVVAADAADPASLAAPAAAADAVVYAVQLQQLDAAETEARALQALIDALESGTDKTFLYTSGVWYYGPTGDRVADEASPPNPLPFGAARPRLERIVFDAAARGVRSIVLRPGAVYGHGGGLPAMYVGMARDSGAARTIGDGANHWSVVHVDDLANAYLLALKQARAGDVFNVSDDSAFTQLQIAQAASRAAGGDGTAVAWPIAEAVASMGAWVEALSLDQRVSSARARTQLGWVPRAASLLDDLVNGSYAAVAP